LQAQCAEWIPLHGVIVVINNNCAHYAFVSCSQDVATRISQTAGRVPEFCGHGTAANTTRLKPVNTNTVALCHRSSCLVTSFYKHVLH
jgi:hypothetical protein